MIISYLAVYSRADIKEGHSIAFGSCNDAERLSMWGAIASKEPDTLILLGDNIYADKKVPAEAWWYRPRVWVKVYSRDD